MNDEVRSASALAFVQERRRRLECYDELLAALCDLVERCDGAEGVREDGSNIQTMRAHAAIAKATGDNDAIA